VDAKVLVFVAYLQENSMTYQVICQDCDDNVKRVERKFVGKKPVNS
jgi:hypothetical protein